MTQTWLAILGTDSRRGRSVGVYLPVIRDEDLADLTPDELRKLRSKIDLLLRSETGRERGDPAPLLYEAIRETLRARGISSPPYSVFSKRSRLAPAFSVAAAAFREYVAEAFTTRREADLRAASTLAAGLATSHLEKVGVPISLNAVIRSAAYFPDRIASQFPGYAESGHLPKVLALLHRGSS